MYCVSSISREPRNAVTVASTQPRLKNPRTSNPQGRNSTTLKTTCSVTRAVSMPVTDSPAVSYPMSARNWNGLSCTWLSPVQSSSSGTGSGSRVCANSPAA